MPTKAFILIETAVGKSKEVAEALQALGTMESVDVVTGPYDVIGVIIAEDLKSIGDSVNTKIHSTIGINRTITCLSVEM